MPQPTDLHKIKKSLIAEFIRLIIAFTFSLILGIYLMLSLLTKEPTINDLYYSQIIIMCSSSLMLIAVTIIANNIAKLHIRHIFCLPGSKDWFKYTDNSIIVITRHNKLKILTSTQSLKDTSDIDMLTMLVQKADIYKKHISNDVSSRIKKADESMILDIIHETN